RVKLVALLACVVICARYGRTRRRCNREKTKEVFNERRKSKHSRTYHPTKLRGHSDRPSATNGLRCLVDRPAGVDQQRRWTRQGGEDFQRPDDSHHGGSEIVQR